MPCFHLHARLKQVLDGVPFRFAGVSTNMTVRIVSAFLMTHPPFPFPFSFLLFNQKTNWSRKHREHGNTSHTTRPDVDPTSFDQPTPPERPNRHISQKPCTSSAFYGPKGACWGNVEQKSIAIVSRYHKTRRRGRQKQKIGKNVVFSGYLVRYGFHPPDMPVQSFRLGHRWNVV